LPLGTSHTVNLPADIAAGNLLLIFFAEMAPTSTPSTVSATGWTAVTGFRTADATPEIAIHAFYRWADGGEGSTVAFTTSVAMKTAHTSHRITGAENPATQPPEAGTGVSGSGTDNADPPSVSGTGGSKDYLFYTSVVLHGETQDPDAPPADYTNMVTTNTGGGGSASTNGFIATAHRQLTAASDDPGVWTYGNTTWATNTLVVHPAGAVVAATKRLLLLGVG
jgi:hypothetical protein